MAKGFSRFVRGATNWGAAASPLGIKVAAPAAVIGGALETLTGGQPKFDREPYDRAFENYMTGAMTDTRRASRELASQSGARMSARGINDSKFASFLQDANNAKLYSGTLRHINDARANLESQIAHAEDMYSQAGDIRERNKWGHTRNMLVEKLDGLANPEGGGMPDANELKSIMESWGFDNSTIDNWMQQMGIGQSEPYEALTYRDHSAGQSGYAAVSPSGQSAKNPTGYGKPKNPAATKANESPVVSQFKENIGGFLTDFLVEAGIDLEDLVTWGSA